MTNYKADYQAALFLQCINKTTIKKGHPIPLLPLAPVVIPPPLAKPCPNNA